MKDLVQLLRPHQYSKNLFIFLPAFFSGRILDIGVLSKCFISFLAFCMVASAVYIFNDIKDINDDRLHPIKKDRPIASNRISKKMGFSMMLVLLVVGFSISFSYKGFPQFLFLYLIMNVLYSYKLKQIPIIDIAIISVGFVIRLFVGSVVADVLLTNWIEIMTFLLALFLGFAKRRDDILIYQKNGSEIRKSIHGYNLIFVDLSIAVISGIIIVAYIMYTVSPEIISKFNSDKLYLTSIFVLIGVLRYMQITYVENKSGDPSKILLHDSFLQIILLCWIASFGLIIYL